MWPWTSYSTSLCFLVIFCERELGLELWEKPMAQGKDLVGCLCRHPWCLWSIQKHGDWHLGTFWLTATSRWDFRS